MKYYILILLLIIFGDCKSLIAQSSLKVTNIVININDIKPDFASEIKSTTTMDFDSRDFVGEITGLRIDRDNIYMLDAFRSKKIFIVDRSTKKLKSTISRLGNSNNEYSSVSDFNVDSKTKDIYILDSNKKMIKRYRSSGEFIDNMNLPFHSTDFMLNGDGTMWIDKGNSDSNESSKSLALIDIRTEKVISNYYDIPDYNKNVNIVPYETLSKIGSLVIYLPSMSNTVYSINKGVISPRYKFDFGNKWPNENMLRKYGASRNPMAMIEELQQEFVLFVNYLESDEWLHVNFTFKDELLGYFYNKKTQKGELYNLEDFERPLYIENDNTFIFIRYTDESTSLVFVTL